MMVDQGGHDKKYEKMNVKMEKKREKERLKKEKEKAQRAEDRANGKRPTTKKKAGGRKGGAGKRFVSTQSQTKYSWHHATPRFQPLPDRQHGAWVE